MRHLLFALMVWGFALSIGTGGALAGENSDVVEDILDRGEVVCGVDGGLPGFSLETRRGRFKFKGFDVDYCRAVAAALFGDPKAVEFVPVSAGDRFGALAAGDFDVLIRNTTHTLTRDAFLQDVGTGVHFAPTTFYDGQGFMTDLATTDIDNVTDLLSFLAGLVGGGSVCVPENTTSEQNLEDLGGSFTIVATDGPSSPAYDLGECDLMSTDKSALAAQIGLLETRVPALQLILGVTISKEPLGPVTLHDDQQWSDIVDWVVYATLFAEEHGITERNVRTFCPPCTSEEERFLGLSGDLGASLGLSQDWAVQVISAVGNYQEIYERNLAPIGLIRSQQNQSHVVGGLLYSPPFR